MPLQNNVPIHRVDVDIFHWISDIFDLRVIRLRRTPQISEPDFMATHAAVVELAAVWCERRESEVYKGTHRPHVAEWWPAPLTCPSCTTTQVGGL